MALAPPGKVQSTPAAEGICHPCLLQARIQPGSEEGDRETARYSDFNRSSPDGLHAVLPQATRKKTRDHLLYGTNQVLVLLNVARYSQPGSPCIG